MPGDVDLSGYPDAYLRCRVRGHMFNFDEPRDVVTVHSDSAPMKIAEFDRAEMCGGWDLEDPNRPPTCGGIRHQLIRTGGGFEVFDTWYDMPKDYAIKGEGFMHRSLFRRELFMRQLQKKTRKKVPS